MQSFDGFLLLAVWVASLGVSAWALIDALVRPAAGYVAAGKLTKPAWVGITAVGLIFDYIAKSPLSMFWMISMVAAAVYLVDVRPAVRGLQRGGNNSSW